MTNAVLGCTVSCAIEEKQYQDVWEERTIVVDPIIVSG